MNSTKRLLFIIAAILLMALCSAAVIYSRERGRDFTIIGKQDGEYVLMPHVPPLIGVKQTAGPKMPESGSLICEFKKERQKTPSGDSIPVLVGHCENGVVVNLTGIDLNH